MSVEQRLVDDIIGDRALISPSEGLGCIKKKKKRYLMCIFVCLHALNWMKNVKVKATELTH